MSFFLVYFICMGVRIVSNVCSGFCSISLVGHVGAQPVVPLVAKDSTARLQRLDSEVRIGLMVFNPFLPSARTFPKIPTMRPRN